MNSSLLHSKPVWVMISVIGMLLMADCLLAVNFSSLNDWQFLASFLVFSVIQKLSMIISVSLCLFFAPWYWSRKVVGNRPNYEMLKYIFSVGIPLTLIMSLTHYFFMEDVLPFFISVTLLVISLVVLAIYIPRFKNALFAILLLWVSIDILHKILLPDMLSWLEITMAMLFMSAICLDLFLKKMDQEIVLLVSLLAVFAVTIPGLSQAGHAVTGNGEDKSKAVMPSQADNHVPREARAGYPA